MFSLLVSRSDSHPAQSLPSQVLRFKVAAVSVCLQTLGNVTILLDTANDILHRCVQQQVLFSCMFLTLKPTCLSLKVFLSSPLPKVRDTELHL